MEIKGGVIAIADSTGASGTVDSLVFTVANVLDGEAVNLATGDAGLRAQSVEAMGDEIDRAEALGLLGVVLHPGCYTSGTEADGLERIGRDLLALLRARRHGKTMILLEHTAGQGTSLGATLSSWLASST